MAKADYFMVLESFSVNLDGVQALYRAGEVVDSSDPAFRRSPQLFGPLVVRRHIEQATAAPGEVRDLPFGKAVSLAGIKGRT